VVGGREVYRDHLLGLGGEMSYSLVVYREPTWT
jgi:hypothetical protein